MFFAMHPVPSSSLLKLSWSILPKETCVPAINSPVCGSSAAPTNALNALAITSDVISVFSCLFFHVFFHNLPLK